MQGGRYAPAAMIAVAVDATALLGRPTGIGAVVAGLLGALADVDDLDVIGYGVTGTGWRQLPGLLPAGVRAARGPLPASVAQRLWARTDHPDLRWWAGRADVVHGTNYVVPPARGAARIVTVHDLTAVRFPELCTPAALRYPGLVRRAVAGGAEVLTGAHWVAAEIEEHFGVPAGRIHVVGWGIDPPGPAVAFAPPAVAKAPPPMPGAPYVLGLGTVEPRKDFPGLVRAFSSVADAVPDVELWIAGPPGWGEDALSEALRTSPVRARIRRLGWVDDIDALVRGASVFAYPSVYEGFGLPPLEAMARGIPVVATAAGAVPEVVGDGAELVAPSDPDALAGAIVALLTDDRRRASMVEAGYRRVEGRTWSATALAMADLYRSLAP